MIEWGGNIDGDWNNPANWSPTFVPGADDDVIIDADDGVPFEVDLNVNASIRSLTINTADATLDVESGRSLTIAEASRIDAGTVQLNGSGRIQGAGALTNNGVINVNGTSTSILNNFAQQGQLNVGIAGGVASPRLTVNDLANSGQIQLGAADSTSPRLVVNNGQTLSNVAGGVLNVVTAATGSAEITGEVVNEGTLDIDADFEFDGAAATVTNRGVIDIAAGTSTVVGDVSVLTFVQESGQLTIDGAFRTDADTFRFAGGTVTGDRPVINGGTLDLDPAAGAVDVIAERTVSLAGDIGADQIVRVQNDGFAESELLSANGFTNEGTIRFEADPDSAAQRRSKLRVANGRLTNAAGGSILATDNIGSFTADELINAGTLDIADTVSVFVDLLTNTGTFDVRADIDFTFNNMEVENSGMLTVAAGVLAEFSATTTYRQNAGSLNVDGQFVASGDFEFNGGDLTGNAPVVENGDLRYAANLANAETIIARRTVDLETDLPAGQTLIVQPGAFAATLLVDDGFLGSGTIRIEREAGSAQTGRIQAGAANGTLEIAAGGSLELAAGGEAPFSLTTLRNRGTLEVETDVLFRSSNGRLINEGRLDIGADASFEIQNTGFGAAQLLNEAGVIDVKGSLTTQGLLKSGGGAFAGAGTILVQNGDLEIEAGNQTAFDVSLRGLADISGNLAAGQRVQIEGVGAAQTSVRLDDGFVNSGRIDLRAADGATGRLSLDSFGGTINNAVGGVIDVSAGTTQFAMGFATFNNQGQFHLRQDLAVQGSAVLNNSGELNIEAGATLTMPAFNASRSTFNQNDGTLVIDGEFSSEGANFQFNGGTIAGAQNPVLLGGTLAISPANDAPVTFEVPRSVTLNSDLNANQTIRITPQSTSQVTLTVGNDFQNSGTILFDAAAGQTGLANLQTSSTSAGVITNTGRLESASGKGRVLTGQLNNAGVIVAGDDLVLDGDVAVDNTGDVTVGPDGVLTLGSTSAFSNPVFTQQATGRLTSDGRFVVENTGIFEFQGGVLDGNQPVVLKNADLDVAAGNQSAGRFRAEGTVDLLGTLSAEQRIEVAAVDGLNATLRLPADFANAGEIVLDESAATTGRAVVQSGNSISPLRNEASGLIGGTGEVRASVLTSAGTLAPGLSPGRLNIDADLVLESTSVVAIEVGGVDPGTQFDRLEVDHDTTLAGELRLSVIDGFAATAGQTFEVITFPSVQGDFATVTGTDIGNGGLLEKEVNADNVTLGVIAPPGLTISDVTVLEADDGTVNAVFTVDLEANGNPVSVDFATEAQTAREGEDFVATSGTLNFASNQTQQTITVPIVGDLRDEDDETFRVLLSNATNAAIPDPEGIGTIQDGDDPQPIVGFSETTARIGEDGESITLRVELDRASGVTTAVDFAVTGGSATAGADFDGVSGTLTFAPDERVGEIVVPIREDALVEGSETIELTLSNAVRSSIGAGTSTVTIDDNDFHPDLVVASSDSPDVANRGEQIAVEWIVRNDGQGDAAGAMLDRVFLSADGVLDAGDTLLTSRNATADLPLAAGASFTAGANVNLPDVEPGDYFLIFVTDAAGQITEDDDDNNTLAEPLTVVSPDLLVTQSTAPAEVAAGTDVNVEFVVSNAGAGDVDRLPSHAVYFSADNVLDEQDTRLDSQAGSRLNAGTEETLTARIEIPEMAPGQYFLIFSADDGQVQFETDEDNNLLTRAITVLAPDLVVSTADAPEVAVLGEQISLSFDVLNQGDAAAAAPRLDRVLFSEDAIADAGDRQLLLRSSSGDAPLAPGESLTISGDANIPLQIAAGDYFLLFIADENLREFEGDETNNVLARPIRIDGADLFVESVDVPAAAEFGDEISVSWTVRNTGTDTVNANVLDQIVLSQNAAGTQSPITLLSQNADDLVPLAPGESYTQTFAATLPLNRSSQTGAFFVVARTDVGNRVAEQNEANNTGSAAIDLTLPPLPDIVVSDISIPVSRANSGDQLEVEWTITNNGDAVATGPWSTSLSLVDGDDTVAARSLGSVDFNGTLAPGQTIVRRQLVTIPVETGFEGPARVVVQVDTGNRVFEHAGDDDNRFVDDDTFELSIREFPNLIVSDVQVPETAVAGQTTEIQWTVTNTGGAPTSVPQWFDGLFLSVDQTFDPVSLSEGADVTLGTAANISFLNPGESYTNTLEVVLPDNLDGNFFVIAVADRPSRVNERNNEGDNIRVSSPIQITLPPAADLQITDISAPQAVFSEQEFVISWTVTNNGDGPTDADTVVDRVFLSPDETISGNDFLLTTNTHRGELQPGESYTESATVTVPVGIQGLELFFLVQTDVLDDTFEHANEENNVSSRPVNVFLSPSPDLVVEDIEAPATVRSGTSISVTYTAANRGLGGTPNTSWVDQIFLSADQTLDEDDLLFGQVGHRGAVGVNETYQETFTRAVSNDFEGEFFVIVVSDGGEAVFESVFEDNNALTSAATVTFESLPADLVVTDIQVPAEASNGDLITVQWTVRNDGTGDTIVDQFRDLILLSTDDTAGNEDDRQLAALRHGPKLAPGESVTVSQVVQIPVDVVGELKLFVRANGAADVFEVNRDNNVSQLATISVAADRADLQIAEVTEQTETPAAGTFREGDLLTLTWTGVNRGIGLTSSNIWRDEIYLSTDAVLDDSDIRLGSAFHSGAIGVDETYTLRKSVRIPDIGGDFHLLIVADAQDDVVETSESNNVFATAATIPIQATPVEVRPDFQVTRVDAPDNAASGQQIDLTYDVTNTGGEAENLSWFDTIFLSLDEVFDSRDTVLRTVFRNQQSIGSGETQTFQASADLPRGIAGDFFVFVKTNSATSSTRVLESDLTNNVGHDSDGLTVELIPPADLVVGEIPVPANATPGQEVTITFTVRNEGDDTARGRWSDSLFLSRNDAFDGDDVFLGEVPHIGDLAPGESYTETVTLALPGVDPGEYFVIVRSDIRNQLPEISEANNIRASLDDVEVDVPALELGVPTDGTLSEGDFNYFKVDVAAGETLRIRLDSESPDAFNQLFVAFDRVPSRADFDLTANEDLGPDQEILVPVTRTGTYFILANGVSVEQAAPAFSIVAETLEFSALSTRVSRGSNIGQVTIPLIGAKLTPITRVALRADDGSEIVAGRTRFVSQSEVWATFDLVGANAGPYDITVEDGNQVAALEESFTVTNGPAGELRINIRAPEVVGGTARRDPVFQFQVEYENVGDTDVIAPIFNLTAAGADIQTPGLDGVFRQDQQFVAVNREGEGPAGILAPGASNTQTFIGRMGAPGGLGGESDAIRDIARIDVVPIELDPESLIASLLDVVVPDSDLRESVSARLLASVEGTPQGLERALADNATHLSQIGQHTADVLRLLLFEVSQLDTVASLVEPVQQIDAAAPGPGVALYLERGFTPNSARVGEFGVFGRGWTHNWDIVLAEDEDDVTIDFVGQREIFEQQDDGTFQGDADNSSRLLREGNQFVHVDRQGFRRTFDPNGLLVRVEDRDGQRVNLTYENLQLVALTHSNGAQLQLDYNADGTVRQLTDHVGRVTTYTYDATGEFLEQVDGRVGQTLYEYDDAGIFSAGLLTSVREASGVRRRFEYDELGRFAAVSRGTDAERTEFRYDGSGGVTIVDADGRTRTVLQTEGGATGLAFDDTGESVSVAFDPAGRTRQTVASGGLIYDLEHDDSGLVTSVTDPAGGATSLSYSESGLLTEAIDAAGVGHQFTYDENGNLASLTYADGTEYAATYNDNGELRSLTDPSGVSQTYSRNALGQITEIEYSSGEVVSYTYDGRGNLLTATDSSGTVTNTWDAEDRLSRIEYPSGRFLEFTFDAFGRRTSSVDSTGFTTRYEYDAANRLSAVRRGDGTAIVQYQHDDLGRLVREDNGNGAFTTYSYDHLDRLLTRVNHAADGSLSSRFAYTYDRFGRQQSLTTLDGMTRFEYDVKGQLVRVETPEGRVLEYEYDAAGNRTAVIDDGVVTDYAIDETGRYTQIGDQTSTYDASGRLTRTEENGVVTEFDYDERGRLVMTSQDGDVTEFEYDAIGRKIGESRNGVRVDVLTDPFGIGLPVAEFADDGSLAGRFIHGNGLAAVVDDSGSERFFEFDGLGNTVKVNDAVGTTLNEYDFLPFGELTRVVETVPNRFRVAGQFAAATDRTGTVSRAGAQAESFRPQEGRRLAASLPRPSSAVDTLRPQTPGGNNPGVNATAANRSIAEVFSQAMNGNAQNPAAAQVSPQQQTFESAFGQLAMSAPAITFESASMDGFGESGPDSFGFADAGGQQESLSDAGVPSNLDLAAERLQEKALEKLEDAGKGLVGKFFKRFNIFEKVYRLAKDGPVQFVKDETIGQVTEVVKDGILLFNALSDLAESIFVRFLRSKDPNDITGPEGFGEERWVPAGERLPFTIRFENVAEATAPAQRVLINTKIDRDIDIRSFRFGDFGFGDFLFDVTDDATFIEERFDFVESAGILVDVQAAVDPRDREVTWLFTAIDPATGLPPEDPTLGFLPPNVGEDGVGEGFANYSIVADTDVPSGTEVTSQATIFFDQNAPIDTNIFVNTIDSGVPISRVNELPELSGEFFEVSWTGNDDAGGSGVGRFDVFVSKDDGPFEPFLIGTTATSAPFQAELEHTYRFFSVAIDNAGNRELAPNGFDASTLATAAVEDGTAPVSEPAAVRDAVAVDFEVTVAAEDPIGPDGQPPSGLRRVDVFVAEDEGEFAFLRSLAPGEDAFVFNGQSNRIYWFRTVAVDIAGNVENKPLAPEAIVIVGDFDAPETRVDSLEAADSGLIGLNLIGTDSGGQGLAAFDVFVAIDGGAPSLIATVDAGPAAAGVHSVSTTFQALTDGVEHTYDFFTIGRDGAGNVEDAPADPDQTLTATFAPPVDIEATGIDVQDGSTQRSFVRFLDIDFTSTDDLQQLIDGGQISLERFDIDSTDVTPGTGDAVDLSGTNFTVIDTGIRLDFGAQGIGGNRNSRIGDGFYRILLDTSGDGQANQSFEFHRIFGDADGDGDADRRDLFRVLRGLRRRNPREFDINGDGRVNFLDVLFTARESLLGKRLEDGLFDLLDD